MKGIRGFIFASGLTCVITFLFVYLMQEDFIRWTDNSSIAVIASKEEHILNEANIVDMLSQYVHTKNIAKVNVRHKKLYIDIQLQQSINSDIRSKQKTESAEQQLLKEIPQLIQFAFFQIHNIDDLYIHVIQRENRSQQPTHYLSLHISKEDEWLSEGIEALQQVNWLDSHYWKEMLRIQE